MDLANLAAEAAKYITPLMPLLVEGGKKVGEEVLKGVLAKIGEDAWDKTTGLWKRIRGKKHVEEAFQRAAEEKNVDKIDGESLRQLISILTRAMSEDSDFKDAVISWRSQVSPKFEHWGDMVSIPKNHGLVVIGNNPNVHITNVSPSAERSAPAAGGPPVDQKSNGTAIRAKYLEKLKKYLNILPLFDFDDTAEIDLKMVYTALDTTEKKGRREAQSKEPSLKNQFLEDEESPLSVLDAINQSSRMVLLGDPGSGKSSCVKQFASQLAARNLEEGNFSGRPQGALPVFVVLHELATAMAKTSGSDFSKQQSTRQQFTEFLGYLKEFLADSLNLEEDEYATFLNREIEEGKVVLIFDGLDEVPNEQREKIRDIVTTISRKCTTIHQIIVTCRIRSYYGDTVFPAKYSVYTLAPLSVTKRKEFIESWYNAYVANGSMKGSDAENRIQDLCAKVEDDDLSEMTENPMMLTNMIMLHRKDTKLPEERVRLYSKIVNLLLNRWHVEQKIPVSKDIHVLLKDSKKLLRLAERLAYEAHDRKAVSDDDLQRKDLLEWLEKDEYLGDPGLAGEFLEYVDKRAGLLMGMGGDGGKRPKSYKFPHRTFREYLAGCYLLRNDRSGSIRRNFGPKVLLGESWALAVQLGAEELFYNRSGEERLLDLLYDLCSVEQTNTQDTWRKVVASARIAMLLERKTVAADIEGGEICGEKYLGILLGNCVNALKCEVLTAFERIDVARLLGKYGDPRFDQAFYALPPRDHLCGFVRIPAGGFKMGGDMFDNEKPVHKVDLYAYYIGRYPVTVDQYRMFLHRTGQEVDEKLGKMGGNLPVTEIDFFQALAYCDWLTEELRASHQTPVELLDKLRSGWKITLPSEAEWEKASRGPDGQEFPWDGPFDAAKANCWMTGISSVCPVGCFSAGRSCYGIEDMAGNVWEWTRSLWGEDWEKMSFPYPYDYKDRRREDLAAGNQVFRVLRGGGFIGNQVLLRCAFRFGVPPDDRINFVGFRVVLSPFSISEL